MAAGLAALLAMTGHARAEPAAPLPAAGGVCERYILAAARTYAVPLAILRAVAHVESGRGGEPWPWTLNIAGTPHYYESAEDTLEAMVDAEGRLRRHMDVGCMQINVAFHGERFAAPRQMLDPYVNVFYGAAYLRALYRQYGDWTKAVARYHAGDGAPAEQRRYICQVLRSEIRLRLNAATPQALRYCGAMVLR